MAPHLTKIRNGFWAIVEPVKYAETKLSPVVAIEDIVGCLARIYQQEANGLRQNLAHCVAKILI